MSDSEVDNLEVLIPATRRVEAAAEAILPRMRMVGGTRRRKAFYLARLALAAADAVPAAERDLPPIRGQNDPML